MSMAFEMQHGAATRFIHAESERIMHAFNKDELTSSVYKYAFYQRAAGTLLLYRRIRLRRRLFDPVHLSENTAHHLMAAQNTHIVPAEVLTVIFLESLCDNTRGLTDGLSSLVFTIAI